MSCEHDCKRAPLFPRLIVNRPGLETIDACIGDYSSMREYMLAKIDAAPALHAWKHRQPDDPGIALVEASAIVGDILAYYQHLYANEAYLRTAKWRESVAELVRVLGYRLAPGLGGLARFALAVKGDRPVRIPAGFRLTAALPSAPKPAAFETTADFDAVTALSKFHLYRPRFVPPITNGIDTFQLDAGNAISLAKGDRLLVGIADGNTLTHTQILIVDKVWETFGIQQVKTQGNIASLLGASKSRVIAFNPVAAGQFVTAAKVVPAAFAAIQSAATAAPAAALVMAPLSMPTAKTAMAKGILSSGLSFLPAFANVLNAGLATALYASAPLLRAYKIGASARHFGHNAPGTRVAVDADGYATEVEVPYMRRLDANQGDPAGPQLRPRQLPLEGEVAAFAAGTRVLIEANLADSADGSNAQKRVLERGVAQVDRQSLAWGTMAGASTVLELDDDLAIAESGTTFDYADIRGITVHQVQGAGFNLFAASRATPVTSGSGLDFFGTRDDAAALAGRTLVLALPGGAQTASVLAVDTGSTGPTQRFFRATLDREFGLSLFEHDRPGVDVYGNVVEATEGATEAEIAIGDGDARESFQTFALPKAPLTYLLDTASTPPQVPELTIWVGRVRWRRVDSLFDAKPRDTVYIVREDADGKSYVQFGDGKTGARLPSGVGNIVAHFRTGTGAHGSLQGDDKPSAPRRLPNFDDVWMLEPATGGAAPESAANARLAAPATMQSLGRIVSLADFEAEALALPGVLKARAVWAAPDGAPLVAVTLLTASGSAADATAVDSALRRALAARGPARWPMTVRIGELRRIRVALTVACDAALRSEDVAEAIAEALGVEDDDPADDLDLGSRGLMHWRMRNFGDGVHGSQVVAVAQNVVGVRWVQLDRLEFALPVAFTRLALAHVVGALGSLPVLGLPVAPSRKNLRAESHQLLSLARADLTIAFVVDTEGAPA